MFERKKNEAPCPSGASFNIRHWPVIFGKQEVGPARGPQLPNVQFADKPVTDGPVYKRLWGVSRKRLSKDKKDCSGRKILPEGR